MDFNDTPQEAAFREEARSFCSKHLEPLIGAPIRKRVPEKELLQLAREWQSTKADNGYAQITWAPEFGGRGGSLIEQAIWNEEEGKFDSPSMPPEGPFTIGLGMCIPTLIECGTAEQKSRYVKPALRGEEVWCQLFSEPAAGSDVAGLKTRAIRDGDTWIVNGQKVWTSGAHYSDYGLLLARTDPSAVKHKGLTMFVVDMRQAGIETRPIHQISGGSEFNEVYFSDVRLSDESRVGEVGEGWRVALVTLMNERLAIGGAPRPNYAEIVEYARTNGLLSDPVFSDRLADWYVQAQGYKLTTFRTLTALSRGQTPGPESSIGKILTANQLQEIASVGVDLQGPYGAVSDPDLSPMEAFFQSTFMMSPALRIAGGTDEILRNIIAERVLGLPQDIRVDKSVPFDQLES